MPVRLRGRVLWIDVKLPGLKRIRKPANVQTSEGAHQEEKDIRLGTPKVVSIAATGLTLGVALRRAWAAEWKDYPSFDTKRKNGQDVITELGDDFPLAKVTASVISDLKHALLAKGHANGTVNRKLAELSAVMHLACDEWEKLVTVPRFKFLEEALGRIRILKHDEETTLLQLLDQHPKPNYREAAIVFRVLMDTGLRPFKEALVLPQREFNYETHAVHVWINKTDNPRTVPLTDRANTILESRMALDRPLGTLTKSQLRHAWDWARGKMGFTDDEEFTIYCLRHTCCTRLFEAGTDAYTVMKIMGHKRIETTMIYEHMGDTRLRAAVDAMQAHKPLKLVTRAVP